MNSEADYQKMTIPHLKEELAKRGITPDPKAKKIELIKLLQKAEEDAILNHSEDGGYGDPLSTPDEDLLNDDVLNDVLPEKLIDEVSEPTKEEEKPAAQSPAKNEKPKPAAITPPHDPLALDAKLKRAQRFGLPVAVTDPLAKAKRAERFGLAVVTSTSEKEMKAKRAERFGLTGQTSPGARVLANADEETKKKLLIRAQRFGLPVNDKGKTTAPQEAVKAPAKHVGLKSSAPDDLEQKKRARLERFGLK
ncbi:hypothetical protein V3C99_002447 [Haemonchus contortus]